MSPIVSVELNDGNTVPLIGYGSGTAWFGATGPDGISPELVEATKTAIQLGYTHLDAAKLYGNERSTGAAIVESGIAREKLFLTTKIIKGLSSMKETLKVQLEDLRVDYVDLYLIHVSTFPNEPDSPNLQEAWKMMEEIRAEGLAKSIGVSNFRISDLEEIFQSATVKPAVNQIEFHPYVWKEAEPLLAYMKKKGIALEAYGSQIPAVKRPGGKLDPILERIASEHQITPGEVLLKWAKAHGAIIVTTSSKPTRMRSFYQAVVDDQDDLVPEEVAEINRAGIEHGVERLFHKYMSE